MPRVNPVAVVSGVTASGVVVPCNTMRAKLKTSTTHIRPQTVAQKALQQHIQQQQLKAQLQQQQQQQQQLQLALQQQNIRQTTLQQAPQQGACSILIGCNLWINVSVKVNINFSGQLLWLVISA